MVAMVLPGGMEVIDARSDRVGGVPPGVQIRPISYLKGQRTLWLNIPCTKEQAEASERNLRSTPPLHRPYDTRGILNFATGSLGDRSWQNESAFFCSDLGIWNLWKIGVLGGPLIEPTRIDPGEALAICWGLHAVKAPAPAGLS
jgi:hypothetical protein